MKITFTARQMNVWDETKQLAEKKLQKLDKYFDEEVSATVKFSCKRDLNNVEITIFKNGTIFRAEVGEDSFANAIDRAVEIIDRQIRKNKTRLQKRLKSGAFEFPNYEPECEDQEFLVRTKEFDLKPMSVEEAIMQMNLLGHEFFMFLSDETREVAVVYKRKDATYGLINPTVYR